MLILEVLIYSKKSFSCARCNSRGVISEFCLSVKIRGTPTINRNQSKELACSKSYMYKNCRCHWTNLGTIMYNNCFTAALFP